MQNQQVIETIGSITKCEHQSSITSPIINNSMVLTNSSPFPGVVKSRQEEKNSCSNFIILRYRYAPEKINRIIENLVYQQNLKLSPSYGMITIFKKFKIIEITDGIL